MEDYQQFKEHYQEKSDFDLIDLARNKKALRLDLIPILQEELSHRGLEEEAAALSKFLFNLEEKAKYESLPYKEFRKIIIDRLEAGESSEAV